MKDVEETISISCVARGSPFGLRYVIAGIVCSITVGWTGSIMTAVSALTQFPATNDDVGVGSDRTRVLDKGIKLSVSDENPREESRATLEGRGVSMVEKASEVVLA